MVAVVHLSKVVDQADSRLKMQLARWEKQLLQYQGAWQSGQSAGLAL